ncbi:uncharacterized protein YALI1_D33901g [Yarrowia lipolytica]|uniref:Uncharacterized protein n=1 Tax=Yarrowia lipolytica TaxID=4952 RepID=A0A1D8NG76_YARLL|nr:hypothetical protein YALI1_D33901g [Yarrowia lipolytica]
MYHNVINALQYIHTCGGTYCSRCALSLGPNNVHLLTRFQLRGRFDFSFERPRKSWTYRRKVIHKDVWPG